MDGTLPELATGESQESSWVKMECAGGEGPPLSSARIRSLTCTRWLAGGGARDSCGKRDPVGHAQRLCACVAPA